MLKMLHLTVIRSDALAIECDVRKTAFDRETIKCSDDCLIVRTAFDVDVIKCTDGCFVSKTLLHSISSRSNDRQLMSELLHSITMKLNALTMLSDVRKAASDFERSNALTKLSVFPKC